MQLFLHIPLGDQFSLSNDYRNIVGFYKDFNL